MTRANGLLFGPLVEYGRGTYDSYVNAVQGNISIVLSFPERRDTRIMNLIIG